MTLTIPKISIIFPSFNGELYLNRNLDSIKELKNLGEIELVIVDNDSKDSSIAIIESYSKDINITLIQQEENLGFAKACNIATLEAKGEFIFITNQDVLFPPDFFLKLTEIHTGVKKEKEVIISPALVFEGDGIHYHGAKNHFLGFSYTPEQGKSLNTTHREVKRTARFSGGTVFLKRDLFLKLGGFDSRLFMYYEDTDLSLRAIRLGYKIFTTNDPFLIHQKHEIITFSDFRYYCLERNRFILFAKNIDNFKKLVPFFLITEFILLFQSVVIKKFKLRIRIYYELISKRKILKRIRKISRSEGALIPYYKFSRELDPVLLNNLKDSNFFNRFLKLFNSVLKLI